MNIKQPYWWCAAGVVVIGVSVGVHMAGTRDSSTATGIKAATVSTIARGAVDANTWYTITGHPIREHGHGAVYVEVKMSGDTGENEHSVGAYPLRATPARWSIGALLSCHDGVRYAVMTVVVKAGERVVASAKGRRYRLRVAKLTFALDRRSRFLYGAVPWAPTEITLQDAAGRKIASQVWTRERCDGSSTTIGELE